MLSAIGQIIVLILKEVFEIKKQKREERKALRKEATGAFKIKDKKLRASRLNSIVHKSKRV